ncbi:MAG: hypothetical protein ABI528_09365 [bacterium]
MLKNILTFLNPDVKKTSSEIVDGKIHYKFQCGIEAHQEELSIDQDEKLVSVMMTLDINQLEAKSQIKDIIDLLLRTKLLYKMLMILLITRDCSNIDEKKLKALKNSELSNVLNDFFFLNPTAINWLKTIGKGLTSIQTIKST